MHWHRKRGGGPGGQGGGKGGKEGARGQGGRARGGQGGGFNGGGGKGGMCPTHFLDWGGGAMVCLCPPPHFYFHIFIFHLNYMFI